MIKFFYILFFIEFEPLFGGKAIVFLLQNHCFICICSLIERFCLIVLRFWSYRYYSATILQMSGVRDDKLAIWLAGLTTLTNFLFTLLGVWLVERVGRRKLTLGSILGRSIWTSTSGSKGYRCFILCYSICTLPSTGTCLSLSLLAVGFLLSAQHSPPVTLHPTYPSLANATCVKYQWVPSAQHSSLTHIQTHSDKPEVLSHCTWVAWSTIYFWFELPLLHYGGKFCTFIFTIQSTINI